MTHQNLSVKRWNHQQDTWMEKGHQSIVKPYSYWNPMSYWKSNWISSKSHLKSTWNPIEFHQNPVNNPIKTQRTIPWQSYWIPSKSHKSHQILENMNNPIENPKTDTRAPWFPHSHQSPGPVPQVFERPPPGPSSTGETLGLTGDIWAYLSDRLI